MRSISVGFSCNNACVFCAQGNLRNTKPRVPAEEVERLIRQALTTHKESLTFQGGEPTLCPELAAWVSLAKSLGAEWVVLQTNGRRLMYPDYAKELAGAGLDAADVSLHGASAAMQEYHTNIPGSFLQTLTGLEQARKAGIAVGVTVVVTRSNFRNLAEIVRLIHARGAQAVHFDIAAPYGKAAQDWPRVVPATEMVLGFLIEAVGLARQLALPIKIMQMSTSPDVERFFAGIGEVDPAGAVPYPQSRVLKDLANLAKPTAGVGETRAAQKKTGEALSEIFPGLFKEPAPEGPARG